MQVWREIDNCFGVWWGKSCPWPKIRKLTQGFDSVKNVVDLVNFHWFEYNKDTMSLMKHIQHICSASRFRTLINLLFHSNQQQQFWPWNAEMLLYNLCSTAMYLTLAQKDNSSFLLLCLFGECQFDLRNKYCAFYFCSVMMCITDKF